MMSEKELPSVPPSSQPSSSKLSSDSSASVYSRSRLRPVGSTSRSASQTSFESREFLRQPSSSTSPVSSKSKATDKGSQKTESPPKMGTTRHTSSDAVASTSAAEAMTPYSSAPGLRGLRQRIAAESSSPTHRALRERRVNTTSEDPGVSTGSGGTACQSAGSPAEGSENVTSCPPDESSPEATLDFQSFQNIQEVNGSGNLPLPGEIVDADDSNSMYDAESADDSTDAEYVVALHDFSSHNSTCLSFEAGQVIRVYNRDASGWWDGELHGQRGWFPSNYVDCGDDVDEAYDEHSDVQLYDTDKYGEEEPQRIDGQMACAKEDLLDERQTISLRPSSRSSTPIAKNLSDLRLQTRQQLYNDGGSSTEDPLHACLEPIEHAILLLHNAVRARRISHFQPSTACVISSVRSVLASTDCLTRESTTLKAHPVLARERKQILAELSKLVAQARRSAEPSRDTDEEGCAEEMTSMLRHADLVLRHVRRFLEVAQECDVPLPGQGKEQERYEYGSTTPSSSKVKRNARDYSPDRGDQDKTPTPDSPQSSPAQVPNTPPRVSSFAHKSRSRATLARGSGSSVSSLVMHTERISQNGRSPDQSTLRRLSMAGNRKEHDEDDASHTDLHAPQEVSDSNGLKTSEECSAAEVLQQIGNANDHLLSTIAAFIGHIHSHSRDSHASSYAFLIDMTRATVDGVRHLLVIVEAVHTTRSLQETKPQQLSVLWETRESIYEAVSALVTAARIMTASQPLPVDNDEKEGTDQHHAPKAGQDIDEKSRLLQCATAVLRTGGECVGAVKLCLQNAEPDLRIRLNTSPPVLASSIEVETPSHEPDRYNAKGHRAKNTLSYLGRKASSLTCLREKYEHGSAQYLVSPPSLFPDFEEEAEDIEDKSQHHQVDIDSKQSNLGQESPIRTDESDSSENMSRQHSRASASTMHSAKTDLTTDTSARPSMDRSKELSSIDDAGPRSAPLLGKFPKGEMPESMASSHRRSASLSRSRDASQPVTAGQRSTSDSAAAKSSQERHNNLVQEFVVSGDHDASEVSYNSEGQLTGATLSALVEKMTPHRTTIDPTVSTAFFMCFRLFTTPLELFGALKLRYNMEPPEEIESDADAVTQWMESKVAPVRLRVFNFLKLWLENHWNAQSDFDVLEPLIDFSQTSMAHSLHRPGQRLAEIAQKRLDAGRDARAVVFALTSHPNGNLVRGPGSLKRVVSSDRQPTMSGLTELSNIYKPSAFPVRGSTLPPQPFVSKSLLSTLKTNASKVSVTDFEPTELARQLTIMESRIYCSILPEELLNQEFSKKAGVSSAVHVKSMSSLSTHITGWVSEIILNEDDARKRTQLVKFFIKLGDRCLSLNNFNTLFAIQGALNSSTIARLKKTWLGLPTKYRLLMEQQRNAVEHTRNFASYRQRLRTTMPPALPFVGLFLTDLTFCHEGNAPTRVSPTDPTKQLLNFDKYIKMSRIIGELQRFQQPFFLLEVSEIQTYLRKALDDVQQSTALQSADELYRRSLRLEPRTTNSSSQSSTYSNEGTSLANIVPPLPTRGGVSLDLFNWRTNMQNS